jgi:PEP-CTERM motif-containing protein
MSVWRKAVLLSIGVTAPMFAQNTEAVTPEPGTLVMVGIGLIAFSAVRLNKNRKP